MNRLTIIGNLTADPTMGSTGSGKEVCNFTVAVNRRKTQQNQNPEADFFRISAWNELGKICNQYLAKGRKVAVVGSVSVNTYTGNDGQTRASMNVLAQDVEFLTPREYDASSSGPGNVAKHGPTPVNVDDLPF